MPYAPDRAASRYGRDRDLLPAGPRLGPYELRYDVRRGYDRPLRPAASEASPADVLHSRAREDDASRAGWPRGIPRTSRPRIRACPSAALRAGLRAP